MVLYHSPEDPALYLQKRKMQNDSSVLLANIESPVPRNYRSISAVLVNRPEPSEHNTGTWYHGNPSSDLSEMHMSSIPPPWVSLR